MKNIALYSLRDFFLPTGLGLEFYSLCVENTKHKVRNTKYEIKTYFKYKLYYKSISNIKKFKKIRRKELANHLPTDGEIAILNNLMK